MKAANERLKEFSRLRNRLEELQTEGNRIEGRLEKLFEDLKDQFDCAILSQAKALLDQLTERRAKLLQRIDKRYTKIKKKYRHLLSE